MDLSKSKYLFSLGKTYRIPQDIDLFLSLFFTLGFPYLM
jgi:hypothetical protein